MNIIKSLEAIIANQLAENKLSRERIDFKLAEIKKHENFIEKYKERIRELEQEIKENRLQTAELVRIAQELREVVKPKQEASLTDV